MKNIKKILIYICLFITFIFIYILQSNFFTWFNIAGVQPNLFVILILFCGLFTGKISGLICGVISGILLDLFMHTSVLIEPIMLGAIGFIIGMVAKNFSKESRLNIMIMVVATTLVYGTGAYILKMLTENVQLELLAFIKIILIEAFYNAMITIIIYPIINYFGPKVENKIFGDKILRYF